jgi:hypothetical protein
VLIEDFPPTLVEFDERFGSEEACRAYLARLRWPEGFRCPACGHPGNSSANRYGQATSGRGDMIEVDKPITPIEEGARMRRGR